MTNVAANVRELFFRREKCHAWGTMDIPGLERQARDAEAKLAKGEPLSREERMSLLARLLTFQDTRKDRKYGQA